MGMSANQQHDTKEIRQIPDMIFTKSLPLRSHHVSCSQMPCYEKLQEKQRM